MVLTERHAPRVSVALLVAGILLLAAGRWVRFDDTSGYGEGTRGWVLLPVLVLALGALVVGVATRASRQALAIALLVLAGLLFVAKRDDGFRFVWAGDEGELLLFQLLLIGLGGWLLLSRSRATSGWRRVRAWIYPVVLLLGPVVGFYVGTAVFEAQECSEPGFDGECDLAGLAGLGWAVTIFLVGVAAIATAELVARRRSRRLSGSR